MRWRVYVDRDQFYIPHIRQIRWWGRQKASGALCALLSGFLLEISGFDAETAKSAAGLPEQVLANMKALYITIPLLGFLFCIILFSFYPLTRKRCLEIKAELDKRNAGQM